MYRLLTLTATSKVTATAAMASFIFNGTETAIQEESTFAPLLIDVLHPRHMPAGVYIPTPTWGRKSLSEDTIASNGDNQLRFSFFLTSGSNFGCFAVAMKVLNELSFIFTVKYLLQIGERYSVCRSFFDCTDVFFFTNESRVSCFYTARQLFFS